MSVWKNYVLCIYDLCPKLSTDFYWVVNVTDRLLGSLFFPWLFYCIVSIFLSLLLYWAGVFCLSRLGPICKKMFSPFMIGQLHISGLSNFFLKKEWKKLIFKCAICPVQCFLTGWKYFRKLFIYLFIVISKSCMYTKSELEF
jgi:hypothetical protein